MKFLEIGQEVETQIVAITDDCIFLDLNTKSEGILEKSELTDENGIVKLNGKELKEGDKIFKTFDGQDILYHGETVFPVFVNEAAYYEKKIAMSRTKRTMESW